MGFLIMIGSALLGILALILTNTKAKNRIIKGIGYLVGLAFIIFAVILAFPS